MANIALATTIVNPSMTRLNSLNYSLNWPCRTAAILWIVAVFSACNGQSQKDVTKSVDLAPKVAPESLHFTPHVIENYDDGSKAEIDTVTGYRKHFYSNGKLQMEGKVTKADSTDYRDGIWKYYNEREQLMNQETYTKEGKINQLEFMYFINGKPLSSTYQYYEGDPKNKQTFRFHKMKFYLILAGKNFLNDIG